MFQDGVSLDTAFADADDFTTREAAYNAAIIAQNNAYRDRTGMSPVSREPKSIYAAPARPKLPPGLKQTAWKAPTPRYARSCKRFSER